MSVEKLKALGISCTRPRKVRHRKLRAEHLALFEREADLILSLTPYKTLAERSGLAIGTVQQIMSQLIRERREKAPIVHRGNQLVDVEILASSATLQG